MQQCHKNDVIFAVQSNSDIILLTQLIYYYQYYHKMCSYVPATGGFRYGWWIVILGGPVAMALAVVQAAIDKNPFIMNIIGAVVSSN